MTLSLRLFRLLLLAATLVGFAAAVLAFLAAPEVGAAYSRAVGPLGTALPLPTAQVALPFLRPVPKDGFSPAATPAWAAALWLVLVAGPWLGFAWALRARDVGTAAARWIAVSSIHGALAALVAVLVLLGLALPFS